jgi:hypothetical protein
MVGKFDYKVEKYQPTIERIPSTLVFKYRSYVGCLDQRLDIENLTKFFKIRTQHVPSQKISFSYTIFYYF